jgi:hypothetical protein
MKPVIYGTRDEPREDATFPKQLKHWFAEFGIHFEPSYGVGYGYRRALTDGCAGRVRHFRALARCGLLQICDGYMDRWANSVGAEVEMPRNQAEFRAAMANLLASAELCKTPVSSLIANAAEKIQRRDRDLEFLEERYGHIVDWVRRYGPYYRSDRKVMHRYVSIRRNSERERALALKHFNYLAPGKDYREYLQKVA